MLRAIPSHAPNARYSQNTTSFRSDHWTTRRSWSLVSDYTRLVCGQINGMKNLPDTVIVSPIRVTFAVALVVDWAAPSPRATQHVLHQLEEQTVASEAQLTRVRRKLQQIKEALKKYTKSEKDYSPQSIERRLQWHFYGKNPPRILKFQLLYCWVRRRHFSARRAAPPRFSREVEQQRARPYRRVEGPTVSTEK